MPDSCSICTHDFPVYSQKSGYKTDKNIKVLPCGHMFHKECIQEWFDQLKKNHRELSCPLCRKCFVEQESKNKLINILKKILFWGSSDVRFISQGVEIGDSDEEDDCCNFFCLNALWSEREITFP